jgi:hypothetical protein
MEGKKDNYWNDETQCLRFTRFKTMEGKKDNYWNDETNVVVRSRDLDGVHKARYNKSRFSEVEDRSNSSKD